VTLSSLFACLCAFSFQFISVLLCTSSINMFLSLVQHVHSCCILWYMMLQCVCVCPSVCHIEMAGPLSTSQCCLLSRELRFRAPVMEQMPLLAFSLSEHWVEAKGKQYYEKKTFSALRAGCKVIQRTIGQKADFSFKLHSEAEKRNQFSFVCISLNTWQKLVNFFMYIQECISYHSVYFILACIKNFV